MGPFTIFISASTIFKNANESIYPCETNTLTGLMDKPRMADSHSSRSKSFYIDNYSFQRIHLSTSLTYYWKNFILHSKFFGEVSVLRLDNQSEAQNLLRRGIEAVTHIMQVRKWYVRAIREFLPKGDCLLGRNWNKGEMIEIRLRVSKSQSNRYAATTPMASVQ